MEKASKLDEEEVKKLIETGAIEEIQAAIDDGVLRVNDTITVRGHEGNVILPHICYAMAVGRPDVLELFLKNHAEVNINMHDNNDLLDVTPLSFAVGDYHFYRDPWFSSSTSSNVMLENMGKYVEKYITLLSDYGAKFDTIDRHGDTIFMGALTNSNPAVFKTTIKEAKKRLPAKKFLELLRHVDSNDRVLYDYIPEPLYDYWQTEGRKLIKELELKVAEEAKKAKEEALKATAEGALGKTKKIAQNVKAPLHATEQKIK